MINLMAIKLFSANLYVLAKVRQCRYKSYKQCRSLRTDIMIIVKEVHGSFSLVRIANIFFLLKMLHQ